MGHQVGAKVRRLNPTLGICVRLWDFSSLQARKAVRHGPTRPQRSAVFFETMSKRRRGFASETKVKRGLRIVHGEKELIEKLGRNDLCPCGSGKQFKKCCRNDGCF